MDIVTIVRQIAEVRESREHVDQETAAQAEQRLSRLRRELSETVPATASEAFLMAAELTYMLHESSENACAVRIADCLTTGLMGLSKAEMTELRALPLESSARH